MFFGRRNVQTHRYLYHSWLIEKDIVSVEVVLNDVMRKYRKIIAYNICHMNIIN